MQLLAAALVDKHLLVHALQPAALPGHVAHVLQLPGFQQPLARQYQRTIRVGHIAHKRTFVTALVVCPHRGHHRHPLIANDLQQTQRVNVQCTGNCHHGLQRRQLVLLGHQRVQGLAADGGQAAQLRLRDAQRSGALGDVWGELFGHSSAGRSAVFTVQQCRLDFS